MVSMPKKKLREYDNDGFMYNFPSPSIHLWVIFPSSCQQCGYLSLYSICSVLFALTSNSHLITHPPEENPKRMRMVWCFKVDGGILYQNCQHSFSTWKTSLSSCHIFTPTAVLFLCVNKGFCLGGNGLRDSAIMQHNWLYVEPLWNLYLH